MLRRFAENQRKDDRPYIVPKVYETLSTASVLTMQLMQGRRIDAIESQEDRKRIATNLVRTAFDMLFVDGLFHADPHPGNCFVLEDNRLALIDFGSVGEVSFSMRETMLVMSAAVGMLDADTVARLLYRVAIPGERVSLHRMRDAFASLFERYLGASATLANIEAARVLKEIFEIASRFKLRIPSEYALMVRAAMTAEGVIRQLDPELKVVEVAQPYVRRLMDSHLSMPNLENSALKSLLRARSFIGELPLSASQILMDLESGKLTLRIDSPQLETVGRSIDALGVTVFMGMVAGGLVTGSFVLLARYNVAPWVPATAVALAGILFWGAIGRYFLAPRMRKWSIARWLARKRR